MTYLCKHADAFFNSMIAYNTNGVFLLEGLDLDMGVYFGSNVSSDNFVHWIKGLQGDLFR